MYLQTMKINTPPNRNSKKGFPRHNDGGGPLVFVNYPRVSGRYDDREASLDTQEAANLKAVRERGGTIVATLPEKDTAKYLWERKVLNQAREMIRTGQANSIVVYALDRLVRTQEHLWIIYDEVRRAGGEILCATEKFEMTPMGKLIMGIYAFKAESERESIRDRCMRGRNSKLEQGKLSGSHGHKFGYRFIIEHPPSGKPIHTGIRQEHQPEASTVRRAFALVLEGNSTKETAEILNREGHMTRSQSLDRRKQSPEWTHQLVLSLIREPAYKGEEVLKFRMDLERNIQIKREEPLRLPGACPAIVSPADWAKANELLSSRSGQVKARQEKTWLLFRGLVWCRCGRKCDANRNRVSSEYHSYICNTRNSQFCGNASLSSSLLDGWAWGDIESFLTDPDRTRKALASQDRQDNRLEAFKASHEDMTARIVTLNGQIERAVKRIVRADEEDIELFEAQLGQLKKDREVAVKGIEEIEQQMAAIEVVALDEELIKVAQEVLREGDLGDEKKRKLLEALRVRVMTDAGDCEVFVPGVGVLSKESTNTFKDDYTTYLPVLKGLRSRKTTSKRRNPVVKIPPSLIETHT